VSKDRSAPPKVLFLHGWSSDGAAKTGFLWSLGYAVRTPRLTNWSFAAALRTAQTTFDEYKPDVIVGSSLGAAVAMAMQRDTPLVLLAPAWRLGPRNGHLGPHAGRLRLRSQFLHGTRVSDRILVLDSSQEGRVLVGFVEALEFLCLDDRLVLGDRLGLLPGGPLLIGFHEFLPELSVRFCLSTHFQNAGDPGAQAQQQEPDPAGNDPGLPGRRQRPPTIHQLLVGPSCAFRGRRFLFLGLLDRCREPPLPLRRR
jgi:hypothetical protein